MGLFLNRRKKLMQYMAEKNIAAVLINSPANLYYYTGFTGGEAFFLMPGDEKIKDSNDGNHGFGDDDKACGMGYVITDSRYYEQVELECPDLELVKLEQKGYSETINELLQTLREKGLIWADGILNENRTESRKEMSPSLPAIGIEDTMELKQYLKLRDTCKAYDFRAESSLINEARMVKDCEELSKLAKAEHIGDMAFSHILSLLKPGVTEVDIALELEYYMKKQGAKGLSFDTIVASGSNSSMPHAQVTDKRIAMGEFVTMDFGCIYQGYCSDMTRTVAVGEPTDEMKKVYRIVLDANLRARDGARAGVSCKAVDALARDYIKEQGYGEYFGHGLGHGVGLEIHEEPRFSPKCDVVTKENMVITDEPGIYLPGRFGVRIEDLLVIKKDGCEVLSKSERGLIIL